MKTLDRTLWKTTLVAALLLAPAAAGAQNERLDRADPARQERTQPKLPSDLDTPTPIAAPTRDASVAPSAILARAIAIDGAVEVPLDDFAPVVADYTGRKLIRGELRALAAAVSGVARARGYPFATASIPPQKLTDGVLRVLLDEGRVDSVRVEGEAGSAVERILTPLANGRPIRQAALERVLLLAGDVPGVTVRSTKIVRESGRPVLLVAATREAASGRIAIDNRSTDELGPVRARLRLDLNRLLADDDQLTVEGGANPLNPREFALAVLGYEKGLGARGATLSASGSYARTRPSGGLADLDTRGESYRLALGASYPLLRTREASVWAALDLYHRRSRQSQLGARIRLDRITALAARLDGVVALGGGRLSGRLVVTQGLDLFDATERGDPLASRRDGDARFTKLEGSLSWTGRLVGDLGLRLAAEGQIASRPLLAFEEFGIGGARFARGYQYSERQGDQGVAGSAELRYEIGDLAKPVRDLQAFGFIDGGLVDDLRIDNDDDELASAGGGLRARLLRRLLADIEVAFPLSGARLDSGDKSPRVAFELRALF